MTSVPILRRMALLASAFLLVSCGGGSDDSLLGISNTGNDTGATSQVDSFTASLTGAEQTPPTASAARASGAATLNRGTRLLQATVTTSGLSGASVHIHEGARGINGPIVLSLMESPAGSGQWSGQSVLSSTQVDTLLAGDMYFDVHTAAFPNGEIRGQLIRQQSTTSTGGTGGVVPGTPGTSTIGLPSPAPITTPVPATTGGGFGNTSSPFGSSTGNGFGTTGIGSTGIGSTGSTGIGSTGIGNTSIGSTGIGSTGIGSTGSGSTIIGSTGTGTTSIGSTGSTGIGSTGVGSTGIGSTSIGSSGTGSTAIGSGTSSLPSFLPNNTGTFTGTLGSAGSTGISGTTGMVSTGTGGTGSLGTSGASAVGAATVFVPGR